MNTEIRPDSNTQVVFTIKYMFPKVKELFFCNNSLSDKQLSDLLIQILEDDKLSLLVKGIGINNNELGNRSISALYRLITEKNINNPLRNLSLVNCILRTNSILPLL